MPRRPPSSGVRTVPRRVALPILLLAFLLSLLFVPFRHRTLVTTPEGGFDFTERRVWAPLWRQPTFESGVAEIPFRWLLGAWGTLALAGVGLVVDARRRARAGGTRS